MMLVGHTDVTAYAGTAGYTNWELSADRANAARRALAQGGIPEEKVARVVGMGSVALFDKNDPKNPIDRRISSRTLSSHGSACEMHDAHDDQHGYGDHHCDYQHQ